MNANPHNPYQACGGLWLRGNFHGHSAWASRCASVPLGGVIRRYRALRAAFTAITDHDTVTDLRRARSRHADLLLLQGLEHSRAENMLFIGERVPPLHELPLGAAMAAAGELLTIAAHPRPHPGKEHWSAAALAALPRAPDGVEVYNGHYGTPRMRAKGCVPLYAAFWDELLTAGMRIWGFANDDSHDAADFGNAWNMVCARVPTASSILEAARLGRFYATTGLLPAAVQGDGELLDISFDEPVTGRYIGPGGVPLAESRERHFSRRLGGERYFRFEAESEAGRLFLQPVHRPD